jgi:hypothetical protein
VGWHDPKPALDIYFTPRCANRLARSGGGEDRKF